MGARKLRSLYVTVAQTFLVVSLVTGLLFATLFFSRWQSFNDRRQQVLGWELAEVLSLEVSPYTQPTVQREAVEDIFARFHQQNPQSEVFLLDSEGKVRVATDDLSVFRTIDVAPIKEFLEVEGYPDEPIYGTEPWIFQGDRVVFSAARIAVGQEQGYLYVSHSSQRAKIVDRFLGDLSASQGAIWLFAITFAISLLLGLALLYYLTYHIRHLTEVVRAFRDGDYSRRIQTTSKDELGVYSETFNAMADKIVSAMDELKAADEQRRFLVADVSHDLRTPIAVLCMQLETLKSEIESLSRAELENRIDKALRTCDGIQKLLEELFELSKMSTPGFELKKETFRLDELIEGVFEQLSETAKSNEVSLRLEAEEELPLASADQELISRTLWNLMDNGIRYSEKGGEVVLSVRGTNELAVEVSDMGVGIPKDELPLIFERFYRASTGKDQAGTGLGLPISYRIIELHGSELVVESIEGQGTTFRFSIPIAHC